MSQSAEPATAGHAINVRNIVKTYGDFTALKSITLDIHDNEFFTLLGPSGCGKTTLLRIIAGFEDIDDGALLLYGENIGELPPYKRPVNTVFQSYALFPHMSVLDNVSFGLEMLGRSKREARRRAGEILELVQLSQFAARRPAQLSGGQQQRVALARALAPEPKVLLLDEPLSALDLKLRKAMQLELKHLQRETGITFIFVTHDQEEALTMSDRIAVMSHGELQQLGGPQDIYERPETHFVADFIGETNLIDVTLTARSDDRALCDLGSGLNLACPLVAGSSAAALATGDRAFVSIRPERMRLVADDAEQKGVREAGQFAGRVIETVYVGTDIQTIVELDSALRLTVRTQNSLAGQAMRFAPGTDVLIEIEPDAARLLVG